MNYCFDEDRNRWLELIGAILRASTSIMGTNQEIPGVDEATVLSSREVLVAGLEDPAPKLPTKNTVPALARSNQEVVLDSKRLSV